MNASHPTDLLSDPSLPLNQTWDQFLIDFVGNQPLQNSPLQAIFESIRHPVVDSMLVVGQLGQTMDGRIATEIGQSKYINGHAGLTHLHQLRALVDAVVVGVGTALADDPQLNVRLVQGKNPARVVIDPRGRLGKHCRIWHADETRKIWIVAQGLDVIPPPEVKVLALPAIDGRIDPISILKHLRLEGFHRILIEGGAQTLSRFLQSRCLDRLHLIVAPIIMGSGRPSFHLTAIEHMDQATRLPVKTHLLDNEVLFDCDLSDQRIAIA